MGGEPGGTELEGFEWSFERFLFLISGMKSHVCLSLPIFYIAHSQLRRNRSEHSQHVSGCINKRGPVIQQVQWNLGLE